MNKLVKTLIIINGIIIPVVLLFMFILLIKDVFMPGSNTDQNQEAGINLENERLTESGDTLVLQGINYSEPEPIYNSTYYYIAIEPKTYDEPEVVSSVKDEVLAEAAYPPSLHSFNSYTCRLNYIFLDKEFNYIGKLVNKKASIIVASFNLYYNEEVDTTIKNIVYLIAFSDTNKDGLLNQFDHHDLYISNLNGSGLTKVTNDIDIVNYKFINQSSEIFITYKDTTDKKEEYKLNRFAVYTINTKSLRFLTSIDKSIKEVLNILNKK